jgi:hypothetical protein
VALFGILAAGPVAAQETLGYSPSPISHSMYAEPPGEFIILDTLFLRPLGMAAMAVGFAGSVASMPFNATSGSENMVAKKLLREPWEYTFCRPLGVIDYEYSNIK